MDTQMVRFVLTTAGMMGMAIAAALMVDAVYRRKWTQMVAYFDAVRASYERQLAQAQDETAQLRAQLAHAQNGGAE